MIKVYKNFIDVPTILKTDNRKEAFETNVSSNQYLDKKNLYKVGSVQKKLNEVYHLKCAYCEQKLLDAPKHIEHYRPKDIYYWLSYSWDNLLLSCGSCNSAKGTKFPIKNSMATYNNEAFMDIHNLGNNYDKLEEPMLINPEKEDVLDKLIFDQSGKMSSLDDRIKYTIEEICNLNRDELLQRRVELLNNFISNIEKHYFLFLKKGDITRFSPDIESFKDKCNKKEEFYSFRYFILKNVDMFFDNRNIVHILRLMITRIEEKCD